MAHTWKFSWSGSRAHVYKGHCTGWWQGYKSLCGTAFINRDEYHHTPYLGWQKRCKTCKKILEKS